MPKIKISNDQLWENWTARVLLTAVTAIVITLLLPHTNVPQFDYELNKPWAHNRLIADIEIPLYKSEEVLARERDSLLAHFEPYYNVSPTVSVGALRRFTDTFANGIPGLPPRYANYVADRLKKLYYLGVIDADIAAKAQKDTTMMVRLISGNTATSTPVRKFMTPVEAYTWLFDDPVMEVQRSVLAKCNLNSYIEPNIILDDDRTATERNDLLGSIPVASGLIQVGEKIIDRGEVVDEKAYIAISSYIRELKQRTTSRTEVLTTYGGQLLYVFLLVGMFTMYLMLYRRDYFEKPRSLAMLYIFVALVPIIVSVSMQHHLVDIYVIPFAMVPMFVRVFMDSRTAFLTHAVIIMICALAVSDKYEFIIIELAGGLTAIFTLRELSRRSQVFIAAIVVSLVEFAVHESIRFIDMTNSITFDLSTAYHFVANAVLLLLAYPFMYLVEKAFGFVSTVTLIELSDTNKSLLRKLSEVAPGTFQHSITVGNLAAEIANRIGAKALLVRTGALYHDIGKMRHPVFFTENQAMVNPHKRLSETDSAQVVMSHITEGIRMAEKENLPLVIQNFIRTHHGTGMTRFFYVQYKNNHPDEDVDEALFTYPGPNPTTREQAILMMADAVEAASRSLSEYTEETISNLVKKIIDSQVAEGFFVDCPITFRDVAMAKDVLIERLMSIYHTRIAYPELNHNNSAQNK